MTLSNAASAPTLPDAASGATPPAPSPSPGATSAAAPDLAAAAASTASVEQVAGAPAAAASVAATATPVASATAPSAPTVAAAPSGLRSAGAGARVWVGAALIALVGAVAAGGLMLAWSTQQRLKLVEQQIVKRQQEVADRAAEARTLAAQAEAVTRDAAAKVALLEARLAEAALDRAQVDEMLRRVVSSREDNLLAEVDATLRVALQHAAITGSPEPVVTALATSDERLARASQPRLERIRLAVARDLDRLRAAASIDLPGLSARIEETARQIDGLPMVAVLDRRGADEASLAPRARPATPVTPSSGPPGDAGEGSAWWVGLMDAGRQWLDDVGAVLGDLVRVTRIDAPEAALLSPQQAWFLRENLKLKLQDARLALLGRQAELARAGLNEAAALLDRYFDPRSRRVLAAVEQVRQLAELAERGSPIQADDTLSALALALSAR